MTDGENSTCCNFVLIYLVIVKYLKCSYMLKKGREMFITLHLALFQNLKKLIEKQCHSVFEKASTL